MLSHVLLRLNVAITNTFIFRASTLWCLTVCTLNLAAHQKEVFDGRQVVINLWQQSRSHLDQSFIDHIAPLNELSSKDLSLASCNRFVRQCRIIHAHLIHFFVSSCHDHITFCESSASASALKSYVQLYTYWKERNFLPLFSFYTKYFDAVARLFVTAIQNAHLHRTVPSWAEHLVAAEQYYFEMAQILKVLENSVHEERYARQLHRYYDLLNFLQDEGKSA